MASEALAELLGISPETPSPNAYQLLGLRTGEADPQRIAGAIAAAVQRLKQRRDQISAESWNEAAAAVKRARKILTDPAAKAAYDARLRNSSSRLPPMTPSAGRAGATSDPLAGLLPRTDPFAPFDFKRATADAAEQSPLEPPSTDRVQTSSSHRSGAEPMTQPSAPLIAVAAGDSVTRPTRQSTSHQHRRRSVAAPWTSPLGLAASAAFLLGGIGAAVYLLTRQAPAAIQGTAALDTPSPTGNDPVRAAPEGGTSAEPSTPDSPAADDAPYPEGLGPAMAAAAASASAKPDPAGTAPATDGPPKAAASEASSPVTPAADPAAPPAPATPPAPAMQSEQQGAVTEERQKEGEQAYQEARQALLTQDWAQIKPLAQQAAQRAAGPEQTDRAARLRQLAEVADYYRSGLVQALEELQAGATFDLSEDLTVLVVEADASMLQIRFNGRSKRYAFDDIPLVLVHKVGRFTMDLGSPTAIAAKAAFQAVCRLSTPDDRQQAIQWLSQIEGEIEGADAKKLITAIEELHAS